MAKVISYGNLKKEQLKKLLDGEKVNPYLSNKNILSLFDNKFLLEIYEYTNAKGENIYSAFDTFDDLVEALRYCSVVRADNTSLWYQKIAERNN